MTLLSVWQGDDEEHPLKIAVNAQTHYR